MAKPNVIELGLGKHAVSIPILHEDRAVLAIDKPVGWMLVPFSWQNTQRNLHAALTSSIAAGDFWARSRNLKFLRHVHRLDADTTGVLLLAKSEGALNSISDLFEQRRVEKVYLAVVHGVPKQTEWTCTIKLGGEPGQIGRVQADPVNGKDAETRFRVLQTREDPVRGPLTLIEAHPLTGRTHQIRVHLAESGFEIIGDKLYGQPEPGGEIPLGLRGVFLGYRCPFTKKNVEISASVKEFFKQYGFTPRS